MRVENRFYIALSSFFYVGYLPLVPGTFGSIAGLAVFYFIKGNAALFGLGTLGFIVLGFLSAGKAERIIGKKDPKYIVIDEVSGMLLSLVFLPHDARVVVCAFVLFRLLDTFKPYPAGRLQNLKGSLGIMSDDLIAALYTNLVLQVAIRLAVAKGS
jgi:phosphatidylglycerophosphatase A